MDAIIQNLGNIIGQNFWLGILIALVAGALTIFTPCSIGSFPLIVAYVGGQNLSKRKAFIYSLFICIGQTIIFMLIGIITSLIGFMFSLGGLNIVWNIILSFLMFFMGLEFVGITKVLSKNNNQMTNKISGKGIWGAFLVGIVGALFSTPCSTPVLASMLAYTQIAGYGIFASGILLLSYSLGHSILLIIAGTTVGFIKNLSNNKKYYILSNVLKIILGILMFAMSAYLIIITFF